MSKLTAFLDQIVTDCKEVPREINPICLKKHILDTLNKFKSDEPYISAFDRLKLSVANLEDEIIIGLLKVVIKYKNLILFLNRLIWGHDSYYTCSNNIALPMDENNLIISKIDGDAFTKYIECNGVTVCCVVVYFAFIHDVYFNNLQLNEQVDDNIIKKTTDDIDNKLKKIDDNYNIFIHTPGSICETFNFDMMSKEQKNDFNDNPFSCGCKSGFMKDGEKIDDIHEEDKKTLSSYGLTFDKFATFLEIFCRDAIGDELNKMFLIEYKSYKGFQECPFTKYTINDNRKYDKKYGKYEYGYWELNITRLIDGKQIFIPSLTIHMIRCHEFCEGDVKYRIDPRGTIEFFGIDLINELIS
jgi:hypothetical protein